MNVDMSTAGRKPCKLFESQTGLKVFPMCIHSTKVPILHCFPWLANPRGAISKRLWSPVSPGSQEVLHEASLQQGHRTLTCRDRLPVPMVSQIESIQPLTRSPIMICRWPNRASIAFTLLKFCRQMLQRFGNEGVDGTLSSGLAADVRNTEFGDPSVKMSPVHQCGPNEALLKCIGFVLMISYDRLEWEDLSKPQLPALCRKQFNYRNVSILFYLSFLSCYFYLFLFYCSLD